LIEIRSTTRRAQPIRAARVSDIAKSILGAGYDLSVVFVGRRLAKATNLRTRAMTYTPNVLSFPISKTAGEIMLCQDLLPREARAFGLKTEAAAASFLIIHGCLHLKGMEHGPKMEAIEDRWLAKLRR
jgi:probable rRNA maturation factor